MIIYAGCLFVMSLLGLGISMGTESSRVVVVRIAAFLVSTPIYGRIFGWW